MEIETLPVRFRKSRKRPVPSRSGPGLLSLESEKKKKSRKAENLAWRFSRTDYTYYTHRPSAMLPFQAAISGTARFSRLYKRPST